MELKYIPRKLDLRGLLEKKSHFLFGPRQTGKTSLIQNTLSEFRYYNLLETKTFLDLSQDLELISKELTPRDKIVIIDEIQRLPDLLNVVQRLIEEKKVHFLLTGSSARKLRRGGVNLLGGRARSRTLHPFSFCELQEKFDLNKAINRGLVPSIYFSDAPDDDLKSYVGDYLKEEIAYESYTRNIPAFSRFLEVAALSNGQMINYTTLGNEAQLSRSTVIEYFQILKDTLIASELLAWNKTIKRKAISTSKYYFFDPGVVRFLQHRSSIHPRSKEFGEALETYLHHELKTYHDYHSLGDLYYWRSVSNYEVDFIALESVAIEVKSTQNLQEQDLKGLKALKEEKKNAVKKFILVYCGERCLHSEGIDIFPLSIFLEKLWAEEL